MITKKVNRYWCEHCKKQGGAKGHMARHERGCTKNPTRICHVCMVLELCQKPIGELTAFFKNIHFDLCSTGDAGDGENDHYSEAMKLRINECLARLRPACGNCPACIMAALRQSNIPVPSATDFDWTNEIKAIWDEINEERRAVAGY